MLDFINFLKSLENLNEEDLRRALTKKIESEEMPKNYASHINPGNIIDMQVGEDVLHGIVLANNTLLLIDPATHNVKGYLRYYTDTTPYKMLRIRQPNIESYKYTDPNIPIVWEREDPKTEMTLSDIEKALGIKSGTLVIK